MARYSLELIRTETDCIIPSNRKLNQDGYYRAWNGSRHVMWHRHIYELHNGPLPQGYEIHHKCYNRACINLDHLEALPGREHTAQGNRERYLDRYSAAKAYWLRARCTGTALGEKFGVSWSCGCLWVKKWSITH